MKIATTLLFVAVLFNINSAQQFRFYHTNNTPRFIRPGTSSDTLLNAFAGGLNAPQLSNIDWNNDGKKDLFIFDKEARKVYSYVFSNGTFIYQPQYEAGFPFFLFGFANLKDHNFDGKPDLFTASFSHNKVTAQPDVDAERIQLFVNKTINYNKPRFVQNANMLFDTGCYIGYPWFRNVEASPIQAVATAYPAFEDMDGDGDIDIFTNVGTYSTNIYYENMKRNKLNIPFPDDTLVYMLRDQCWGFISYNFNHYFNLGVGRETDFNCFYQTWSKRAQKHADQSSLLIDLNGDGIKDLVIGDYEHKSLISLINGRLQNSVQADSIVSQDTLFLSINGTRKEFIEYPSAYYVDISGDNKQELVISTNSTTASKSRNNFWLYDATRNGSNLDFTEIPGNDFLYKEMIDLGMRSVPVFIDIDSDGDKDLIVATSGVREQTNNNHDRLYLYKNITDSIYPVFELIDSNFANISGSSSQGFFFAHPTFGDLNGDGKPDMIIGEGNGNMAYFENTSATADNYTFNMVDRNAFGILAGSYATPQLIDLDKDGLLDIVSGNTAGRIMYFRNHGTSTAPSFNSTPDIDSLGKISTVEVFKAVGVPDFYDIVGHSTPHITDLDNDGRFELLSGSSNGKLLIYTNIYPERDSVARLAETVIVDYGTENSLGYNKRFGSRNSIATAFLDGDNYLDIVMGNIAGGLTYLNTNNIYNSAGDKTSDNVKPDVYPNPASDILNIASINISDGFIYEIIDLSGRLIKKGIVLSPQTMQGIGVSDVGEGMYFINIQTKNTSGTAKFIIAR